MPNFKEIRAQLEQANKVADQLSTVAGLDESLVNKAQQDVRNGKAMQHNAQLKVAQIYARGLQSILFVYLVVQKLEVKSKVLKLSDS